MIINYEGKQYSLDLSDLTVKQAYVIKAFSGYNLQQFEENLLEIDPAALICLYWVMLAQNGEEVPIETVDFKVMHLAMAFADAVNAENERKKALAEAEGPKDEAAAE